MNDDELKGFRAGYEHWNSHRSIPIRDCGYCEEYFDSVAAAFPRLIERLEASESKVVEIDTENGELKRKLAEARKEIVHLKTVNEIKQKQKEEMYQTVPIGIIGRRRE